ncbi:MAG: hypothetical protein WCO00_04520 [Rhodospirillaceae bacterium]
MDEFITDDQLCDALGLELTDYHKIVDRLRLKKYNITGIIKVIIKESIEKIEERKDAIYSHNFNNINPKVVWAWNIDVAEEIAQKILDYKQSSRIIQS